MTSYGDRGIIFSALFQFLFILHARSLMSTENRGSERSYGGDRTAGSERSYGGGIIAGSNMVWLVVGIEIGGRWRRVKDYAVVREIRDGFGREGCRRW
ncbi:hypothetical protein TSUD_241730 [Trifolium subterraneum]|uniref:Uncharacterized protein n=1 Tax=Trifolium subterraneum TaxID=3900 RepID=A0A2Z6P5D1_TRISU|nr:hypothetical protein TSUD_241730 [Trifolium subterraneum]